MKKLLAAFSDKQIRECHTLILWLQKNNKSIAEFLDYASMIKEATRKHYEAMKLFKESLACPDCGKLLRIVPVNVSASTRVSEEFNCVVFCPDWKNCGYERYSTRTAQKELEALRRRRR